MKKTYFIFGFFITLLIIFLHPKISNASTLNITVDSTSASGAIITVSSDTEIYSLTLLKESSAGQYVKFYKNNETGYTSKKFFISKYRLSTTNSVNIKAIAYDKDGNIFSSDNSKIDKIPEKEETSNDNSSNNNNNSSGESSKSNNSNSNGSSNSNSNNNNSDNEDSNNDNSNNSNSSNNVSNSSNSNNSDSNNSDSSNKTSNSSNSNNSNNNNNSSNEKATPTSIKLNKPKLTLTIGETKSAKLVPTLSPKNADNTLTWSTSNKNVATVDKNGLVTARKSGTATITVKTSNGKTATCEVTVKIKKIDKTINSKNASKLLSVTTSNGCTSAQSFCITDNYYVCAKINSSNSLGKISVYSKSSKKRVNVLSGSFYHANGSTYYPDKKSVYIAHMKNKKGSIIKSSNLTASKLKRSSITFPTSASGIAYDSYTQNWVLKGGSNIKVYNQDLTERINKFTVKYTVGQDCGVYNGLLLSIDCGGNPSYSKSYIYIYNYLTKEYYGKFYISNLGELESIDYDSSSGKFVMFFNTKDGKDYLYTTSAINLKNYY